MVGEPGSPGGKRLPRELTSFVGRRREIREIKEALSSTPLVTLIGPSGVGKTRLAIKTASTLNRAFADGVWVSELAELHDPTLLAESVANAVGLRDASTRWVMSTLADFLGARQLLLILDNCEHLTDACAVLADGLLQACPELKILCTSREPLGVDGETVMQTAPLPLPGEDPVPPEALVRYEAVRLFVDRAGAAWPPFELDASNADAVAALCRSLDGLPLALELAAARLRAFTPGQILEQIDRRFELLSTGRRTRTGRHQSLRAAVDWSFDLLSPDEQTLWCRLSIFPAGFDLEGAEAICGGEGLTGAVPELVAGLVEKSILQRELSESTPRYRMLETIRSYGRERLSSSGEEDRIRVSHRDHYARLAAGVHEHNWGSSQVEWWDRAHAELANLREALAACLAHPDPHAGEVGLAMVADLDYYWLTRGHINEGLRWVDRLLEAFGSPTRGRVRALGAGAQLALSAGDGDRGLELLDACESITREPDDAEVSAQISFLRGTSAMILRGDLDAAQTQLERCLELQAGLPDRRFAGNALAGLAAVWSERGDHARATETFEMAIALCREVGERYLLVWMLHTQGKEAWHLGSWDHAIALERESLRMGRPIGTPIVVAHSIEVLAWTEASSGRPERAARLLGGLQALWDAIPARLFQHYVRYHEACLADVRSAVGEARFERLTRDGRELSTNQLVAFALEEEEAAVEESSVTATYPELTRRESEIARLVSQGLSNREIASKLVISQRTAETHVEHILTKLGFTSRAQIAAWVVEEEASFGSRG